MVPDGNSKLSGEVRGDVIYIYDESEAEALVTLKHEFIGHSISGVREHAKELHRETDLQA